MKVMIISLFAFISFVVFGQDSDSTRLELSSVDFSAGKSYLSGGFSLGIGFQRNSANTLIFLKEDKIFVNHVYPISKIRTLLGPSFGYFQNVPFTGAIIHFNPHRLISTMHWAGYSFGKPDGKMNINPDFLFLINSVTLKFREFKAYYVAVKFMELPIKNVVGISYQQKMSKNIHAYTNIGYDLTNDEQLLQIGVVWRK